LQSLIADANLRRRYAVLARKRAENFVPAAMVAAYEQAYAEIALRRPGGGRRAGIGGA